jgi:hypothetical protein
MKDQHANRKVIVAAAVASCLMLCSGVTYRVLANRLNCIWNAAPLDKNALVEFSLQIENWMGHDIKLDGRNQSIYRAPVRCVHSRCKGAKGFKLRLNIDSGDSPWHPSEILSQLHFSG